MASSELSPDFAAQLANDVYLVKDELGRRALMVDYKDKMEVGDRSLITGKTGALMVVKKSQLAAMFSVGKATYQGQAFIAFKGTASLYDALTDVNTGVKTSHTGCRVHQGFHYAFDSVLTELRRFMAALKGIHTIHCVGHSLGGAIATLAADWIRVSGASATVKLYTFGSPRVGLDMFARKCTSRVTAGNIYRVYHQTDPIPMVPTWPFYHVPTSSADYAIWSPIGVPGEYHLMKHYVSSVEVAGSWEVMKKNRPQGFVDATIEEWLKSDGVLPFTANTLELLSAALYYVLKKATNAAGILIISGGGATTFTLLDRMAILLAKATNVSVDASSWIYHLVKKMAALIGVVIREGTSLTAEFIRMVFLRLHRKVADLIWHVSRQV